LIPKIIFAAQSGTGKTTLITELIPYFNALHVPTGYIKHHHGSFESRKDSHIVREAGCNRSLLIANNVFIIEDPALVMSQNSPEFIDVIEKTYFKSVRLILIEGFKNNLILPKILIYRDGLGNEDWIFKQKNDKNIIAAVSDTLFSSTLPYPLFTFNELKPLAKFICLHFKLLTDTEKGV